MASQPPNEDDGDAEGERRGVPEPLIDVLRDPSQGKYRLPYLVGLLDEDAVTQRLGASWALSLIAETNEDMLEYVVRRLTDRLGEDSPIEIRHTLDYLAARHPKGVDEILVELDDEAEVRARRQMYQTGGGFARNDYLTPSESDRPIGRSEIASGPITDDPRKVYSGPESEVERIERLDGDENEDDEDEDDEPRGPGGLTRGRIANLTDRLRDIIGDSLFDEMEVLSRPHSERYAEVYRTRGVEDEEPVAVAMHVFELPEEGRQEFVERFRDQLTRWTTIDGYENVVTVHDWGWHPRPWAALEYTDLTLEDRDAFGVQEAVWNSIKLAEAVSYAHQQSVVHGAIDPRNVAYYGNVLNDDEREHPLLTNVALIDAFRWFFDPAQFLDPRYAAPEYFSDQYGSIDPSTDVYQLGMVVYRICTGRPPFTGNFDEIRRQAVGDQPPAPSMVNDELPAAVDQIVGKATAKQKLTRYETVNHMAQELRSVHEELEDAD
jgi:serine/threonine protein kinase